MTDGHKAKRTRRIQGVLDDLIRCRKQGTLKNKNILTILTRIDSRWGLDNRQVSRICMQREDLRKADTNLWQIVEVPA